MRWGIVATLIFFSGFAFAADKPWVHDEITSLSVNEASTLVRNAILGPPDNHNPIDLNNLRKLDATVAKVLAQNNHRLSLNKISRLSSGVADALQGFSGNLYLLGLKVLSTSDAKKLAKSRCTNLYVGIPRINSMQAEEFELYNGFSINFSNVKTLSSDCAKHLTSYQCKKVYLPSLTSIDKETLSIIKSDKKIDVPESLLDQ